MEIQEINNKIAQQYCKVTNDKISDENLFELYKQMPSVKSREEELTNILEKHFGELKLSLNVEGSNSIFENKIKDIIKDYYHRLIPPGTKGIRGNQFNSIIKEYLLSLNLADRFEIEFEKNHENKDFHTDEKPDWYIFDKLTNKILIGMNQLSISGGGHQSNRGAKYLGDEKHNTDNCKLLCVICYKETIKKKTNKTFKHFNIGFENNTLCYIKGLNQIINKFFNINSN